MSRPDRSSLGVDPLPLINSNATSTRLRLVRLVTPCTYSNPSESHHFLCSDIQHRKGDASIQIQLFHDFPEPHDGVLNRICPSRNICGAHILICLP